MKAFKVDEKGDLILENGDLVMIDGDEEIAQSMERRLSTNKNEWFLDLEFGLDYDAIRGKGVTRDRVELAITEAIYQDERIEDTALITNEVDNKTRLSDMGVIAKVGDTDIEIDSLEGVLLIE